MAGECDFHYLLSERRQFNNSGFAQGYVKKALNTIALVQLGEKTPTHRRPTPKKVAIVANMPYLIWFTYSRQPVSTFPQDKHADEMGFVFQRKRGARLHFIINIQKKKHSSRMRPWNQCGKKKSPIQLNECPMIPWMVEISLFAHALREIVYIVGANTWASVC